MVTQPHQRSRLDGAWSRLDHTFGKHGLKFMQHLPKYIYAPLEPRNIRILELQPGRSGPFRAHFSVVSVDSGIEYDALSYMWGEATPVGHVLVGGAAIPIASNLRTALKYLRIYSGENKSLRIWIDAICINQDDRDERAQQISMMQHIYQNACCVRVWINESFDKHNEAVIALQTFDAEFPEGSNASKRWEYNLGVGADPRFWKPVVPLFRNEYWQRIWIQQEILSSKKVVIHCRNISFPGSDFAGFHQAVGRVLYTEIDPTYRHQLEQCQLQGPFKFLIFTALAMHDGAHGAGVNTALRGFLITNLLDLCNSLHASNSLDRVFAIMHLAEDYKKGDITIDYGKTMVELMLEIAALHVSRHRNLSFLEHSIFDSRRSAVCDDWKRMPTWIPRTWGGLGDTKNVTREPLWRSRHHSCSLQSVDLVQKQLYARGIRIDNVQENFAPACGSSSTPLEFWSSPLGTHLQDLFGTGVPPDLLDLLSENDHEHNELASGLLAYFRLRFLTNHPLGLYRVASEHPELQEPLSEVACLSLIHAMEVLYAQSVILTGAGFYGLVSDCSVVQGDEVWSLLGSDYLTILRQQPDGTYWHICSACFAALDSHEDLKYLVNESIPGDIVGKWVVEDITLV